MKRFIGGVSTLALALAFTAACSTYREGSREVTSPNESLERQAQSAIEDFQERDPGLQRFFDDSAGYTVFPEVGKGAVGIGGAHGEGVVYENDQVIGYSTLTQGTIGVQLGGQRYREIIFFQRAGDLEKFKEGRFEMAAQASAVAAASGAAANADYREGVAVFTLPLGGLMFEAAIGGQKFSFRSLEGQETEAQQRTDMEVQQRPAEQRTPQEPSERDTQWNEQRTQ
jgi:lipid-binding SYLF domain-containing protein